MGELLGGERGGCDPWRLYGDERGMARSTSPLRVRRAHRRVANPQAGLVRPSPLAQPWRIRMRENFCPGEAGVQGNQSADRTRTRNARAGLGSKDRFLSAERCLEIHRLMVRSRALEERTIKMSKSGEGY